MRSSLPLLCLLTLLSGCASDFLKNIEGKAYDAAAKQLSEYCKITTDDPVKQLLRTEERIEMRREIRQRGWNGPEDAPEFTVPSIGENTAYGDGPAIIIWCDTDEVPPDLWIPYYTRIY